MPKTPPSIDDIEHHGARYWFGIAERFLELSIKLSRENRKLREIIAQFPDTKHPQGIQPTPLQESPQVE